MERTGWEVKRLSDVEKEVKGKFRVRERERKVSTIFNTRRSRKEKWKTSRNWKWKIDGKRTGWKVKRESDVEKEEKKKSGRGRESKHHFLQHEKRKRKLEKVGREVEKKSKWVGARKHNGKVMLEMRLEENNYSRWGKEGNGRLYRWETRQWKLCRNMK